MKVCTETKYNLGQWVNVKHRGEVYYGQITMIKVYRAQKSAGWRVSYDVQIGVFSGIYGIREEDIFEVEE